MHAPEDKRLHIHGHKNKRQINSFKYKTHNEQHSLKGYHKNAASKEKQIIHLYFLNVLNAIFRNPTEDQKPLVNTSPLPELQPSPGYQWKATSF